jgi:hypothetical protein
MNPLDFKNINIGILIQKYVKEGQIEMERICNFMGCEEEDVKAMYEQSDLRSELLLKWCKLLKYDFFRVYSQHLILFAPPKSVKADKQGKNKTLLSQFRKNLYTKEMIDFIIEMIKSGEKSKQQVIIEYNIPKTTLYKWLQKY